MKRILIRTGIILFCLWHMFAVGITSIPRSAKDDFSVASRRILPFVSPYLQTTSQWQLWDLFAPDPLRRVTLYRIEAQTNGEWTEIATIKPGTYSVLEHAVFFKYFINVLNASGDSMTKAKEQFLSIQCKEHQLHGGTPIRLTLLATVIPYLAKPAPADMWTQWTPSFERTIEATTLCPFPEQQS